MQLVFGKYVLVDVKDKHTVINDIVAREQINECREQDITRAMAVYRDDGLLCGYFLTCDFGGIRSFHGSKFVKGDLMIQFQMAKKYIDMENLKFSIYRNKGAGIVLKRLGFKDITSVNGATVAQRS